MATIGVIKHFPIISKLLNTQLQAKNTIVSQITWKNNIAELEIYRL